MDPMQMWSSNFDASSLDGQLQQPGGTSGNMGNSGLFMGATSPQGTNNMM